MQIRDCRIFRILTHFAHISAKYAYRIFFPRELSFSMAILVLFGFLLPISIRFRYLDDLVANRMAPSMCPDPSGTRWSSWFHAILCHISAAYLVFMMMLHKNEWIYLMENPQDNNTDMPNYKSVRNMTRRVIVGTESRYQKGKTNLDFTEARDSEWQWHQLGRMQVCTSLQTDNHASTPPLCFTGRMPFLPPNQQRQSTEGKKGIAEPGAKSETVER